MTSPEMTTRTKAPMTQMLEGLGRRLARLDRVILAIALLALAVWLLAPADVAQRSLIFTLESALGILPFLLVSALAAGWLSAAGADKAIGRAFQGHPAMIILSAALFGGLSPFCSCGVIPIIAALLAAGVPLPAVMAFWLASPIMDPEMFIITAGGIGLPFAVAKTVAAIGIGALGGFATQALLSAGAFADPLKAMAGCGGCRPAISAERPHWTFWREPARRGVFQERFTWTMGFLGKWLLLAFALESLMVEYLPAEMVSGWLGSDSALAVPLAVLFGIPAYMNGYAAVPLVAGLMQSGMAAGPALAFMAAGAVTSIPAAVAVYALVRFRVFAWYLALGTGGSALAGYLYGFVL